MEAPKPNSYNEQTSKFNCIESICSIHWISMLVSCQKLTLKKELRVSVRKASGNMLDYPS